MAFISQPNKDYIRPSLRALTPLELYLERVKSIPDNIRFTTAGMAYLPMHFGGIKGQQESLLTNSVIKIVDFKVTNDD
jgi:hypothetical protein